MLKIKVKDQARFVEMAAKHFALLTERIQLSGEVAIIERLKAARERAAAKHADG